MRKFYLKLLRGNIKDYALVMAVGTITVSLIYSTTALTAYLYQIGEGRARTGTEIYGQLGIFIITYLLMIVLLNVVIFEYIRKRKYVYGVLNVLGISKKQRNRFISLEYAGIVIVSVVLGLVTGIFIEILMRKAIIKFLLYGNSDVISGNKTIPLVLTLIISFLVFVVLFLISDQLIACLGIEAILSPKRNRQSSLTKRKIFLIFALLLEVFAIGSYFGYWGMLYKLFPVVLGSVGLYILLMFSGEKILEKNRERKRKYYRNLTWTCNWYEQLPYYLNQAYLIVVLIIVTLAVLGISFLDHCPTVEEENYPYDIVWMANQEDLSFLQKLEEEYECEIQTKECVRVTTPDFGEHMGISVSEYNQWTNQNLKIEGEEIFIIYQRERKQRNELGIDYGRKRPRIYIGNATFDLWIWEGPKIMPGNRFDKSYKVAGETDLVLTGVFESTALKKMKSGVWEDIIVFSDTYFQKIQTEAKGANLTVMINVLDNQYEQVLAMVIEYAKIHSQTNFFSTDNSNLIYEKKKIISEAQNQNLIQLVSVCINGVVLLFCGIFILMIKHKNDAKELCKRYQFYEKMGMENRIRNKNISKESLIFTIIAVLCSGAIGIPLAMVEIFRKHLAIKWDVIYITGVIGIYGSLIVIYAVVTWILARQDISTIERGK